MSEQSELEKPGSKKNKRAKGKRSIFSQRHKWNKAAPMRNIYNGLLRGVLSMIGKFNIVGSEHIPATGGGIVIINHVHWLDPVLLLTCTNRTIVPLAKVEAFESFLARIMVAPYGAIPVHRGEVDLQAIRAASEVIQEGGLVLISPEGTRSKTGALIQAQEGLAFLATRNDALIIPVALVGTTEAYKHLWKLQRANFNINIGEPFKLGNPGGGKVTRDQLHSMTDYAMRRLAALLPAEMRGVYGY